MSAAQGQHKKEAERMRKQGHSYGEIRKKIGVSKGTLSAWLKDIPLSPEHRERLYTKQIQILSRGPQSQKERRKRQVDGIIEGSKSEIAIPLSEQAFKLFGAALYWGEGTKGNMFQVTNSDPRLILFMARWIEKIFHVKRTALKARLNVYPQQDEVRIKKFWSELTGIPLKNFGKTYVKPFSRDYKTNNLYYGTMRIEVPKSGDYIHQVYGWTQAVLQREDTYVRVIEKRWVRLTNTKRPVNLRI
jgi:hypothetical protein